MDSIVNTKKKHLLLVKLNHKKSDFENFKIAFFMINNTLLNY
jgi:hypothetical protein